MSIAGALALPEGPIKDDKAIQGGQAAKDAKPPAQGAAQAPPGGQAVQGGQAVEGAQGGQGAEGGQDTGTFPLYQQSLLLTIHQKLTKRVKKRDGADGEDVEGVVTAIMMKLLKRFANVALVSVTVVASKGPLSVERKERGRKFMDGTICAVCIDRSMIKVGTASCFILAIFFVYIFCKGVVLI